MVTALGRPNGVRDEVGLDVVEPADDLIPGLLVERPGRLVREQHLRLLHLGVVQAAV